MVQFDLYKTNHLFDGTGIIRKCSAQGKELKLPESVPLEIPCIGKNE
jgi:hypothetical protein